MNAITESHLNLKLIARGKVRDMYELDASHLVVVTSDRLSAFDVVLPSPIPGKGSVLTLCTRFWMNFLSVPNHLPKNPAEFSGLIQELANSQEGLSPTQIEVVRKAEMLPVECVVRGYLTGSGWKDYLQTGAVCGHNLPKNLLQCSELNEPLFTPATKALEGHDENISFEQTVNIVGKEMAVKLRDFSMEVYSKGRDHAKARGILIADTKFEFGIIDGELCLTDEVMTPDSSRFWPVIKYEPGHDQPSYDKQIVRNYLTEIGWNKTPPGPVLPKLIIEKTSAAYQEIFERLKA